jgi:uncharacterized membrane protein
VGQILGPFTAGFGVEFWGFGYTMFLLGILTILYSVLYMFVCLRKVTAVAKTEDFEANSKELLVNN